MAVDVLTLLTVIITGTAVRCWHRVGAMPRPTLKKVRHLLDGPAATQPTVVRLGDGSCTPSRPHPIGITSASLSQLPSHLSYQVLS